MPEKYLDKDEEIRYLRALLEEEKLKRKSAESKIKEEQNKRLKAEDNLQTEKNKRQEAEEKLVNTEKAFVAVFKLVSKALENAEVLQEEIICRYFSNFDGTANEAYEAFLNFMAEVQRLIGTKAKLQGMLFVEGNEKIDPDKAKDAADDLNNLCRGTNLETKSFGGLYTALDRLGQKGSLDKDPLLKSLADVTKKINRYENKSEAKKPTHRGKVNNKSELSKRRVTPLHEPVASECPQCHGTNLVSLGDKSEEIKTAMYLCIDKAVQTVVEKHGHQIDFCPQCGKFVAHFHDGEDHPIYPGREISTNTVIDLTQMMVLGLPIDRAGKNFERLAKLGSNTVSYSVHQYTQTYLKPLYNALMNTLKKQSMIYSDETTWNCLQDQGRGKMPKAAKSCEGRSNNFILSLGTAGACQQKVNLYHYLKTRSAENISSVISSDFEFDVLITDAYPAYQTVMKQHPNAKLQNCLVHFRRILLEAVRLDKFVKESAELSEEAIEERILAGLESLNPATQLTTSLYALSKIFTCERLKKQKAPGSADYLELHQLQNQLFDIIDVEIKNAAKDRLIEKGNKQTSRKGDLIAKACVYYLNNKEFLRTFLSDPAIPIDTNPVERLIRAIASYRKTCPYKHSPEYSQSMCIIMSVYATLSANGIEDPANWLRIYSTKLYKHMLENALYLANKANNPDDKTELLKKRIRKENKVDSSADKGCALTEENLVAGFDFERYAASIFSAI